MGKREQHNKRSYEQVEQGDDPMTGVKDEQMDPANDTNNNSGDNNKSTAAQKKNINMKKQQQQQEQAHVKKEQHQNQQDEEEFEDAEQDDEENEDEEDVVEEEEEIEEEVEEEEDDEDEEIIEKEQNKGSNQAANQSQSSSGQQNSGSYVNAGNNTDKRPRLTDELFEMNLRRKKEHVGSALYIPFPRKVTEEEVRSFVGQGPNIFLVGPQKQNAIVRYRTQTDCERQQKELSKKEFEGQTLNIEPKTVKIDPANIDVKTLIVQYSNPDLTIVDFAQIFIKAISISLKGGKSKRESQEDLSFGSAIIIFPSHDEAKEAFLATENLIIKEEHLRVVFADFRPAGAGIRPSQGGFNFRNKGGDNNRGNYNRGGNQGGRPGNFRNRNRQGGGGGGGGGAPGNQNRGFGPRNFGNQNSGGGNYNQGGGGRNYSPNKKFRSNVRS